MEFTKQTRNSLGISQSSFADLLNCTEGQLAMHETGKRALPAASVHALSLLQAALAQVSAAISTDRQPALPTRHVRQLELQLENNIGKLQSIEQKMKQAQLLLLIGSLFEEAPFLPDVGEVHARMKLLKRQAERKLQALWREWTRTQLLIAGIDAQIQKAHELGIF